MTPELDRVAPEVREVVIRILQAEGATCGCKPEATSGLASGTLCPPHREALFGPMPTVGEVSPRDA